MKDVLSRVEAPLRDEYMLGFYHKDCAPDGDIKSRMKNIPQLSRGIIETRVHAELLLVDLFSRRNFAFENDDRYIGCSKGACYYCASYIKVHHKTFVRPATHNKIILGCRGPEANPALDKAGKGEQILLKMEQKMNWQLEQDILESVGRPLQRIGFQHLSTNGSSRTSSVMPTRTAARR